MGTNGFWGGNGHDLDWDQLSGGLWPGPSENLWYWSYCTWYMVPGTWSHCIGIGIDIGIDHNAKLDVSGCKHHLDFEK